MTASHTDRVGSHNSVLRNKTPRDDPRSHQVVPFAHQRLDTDVDPVDDSVDAIDNRRFDVNPTQQPTDLIDNRGGPNGL